MKAKLTALFTLFIFSIFLGKLKLNPLGMTRAFSSGIGTNRVKYSLKGREVKITLLIVSLYHYCPVNPEIDSVG